MIRVDVSLRAEADLSEIIQDLVRVAGPGVARTYLARIQGVYTLLSQQPRMGSPRYRLGRRVRLSVVAPYLVFYRLTDDSVTILRILHGRGRITATLLQRTS